MVERMKNRKENLQKKEENRTICKRIAFERMKNRKKNKR